MNPSPSNSIHSENPELLTDYQDLSERIQVGITGDFDKDMIGTDVIFIVQEQRFYGHRFMLASSSSVFKAMLTGPMKEGQQREVAVNEIAPSIFKLVLQYIYIGAIELSCQTAIPVINAAELFALKGLLCVCKKYILRNAQDVFVTSRTIAELPEKLLVEFMEDDKLQIREVQLFESIVLWGEARVTIENQLLDVLKDVVKHVRFPLMSVSDLYVKVKPLVEKAIPSELLIEALFFQLNWGAHPESTERTRPRTVAIEKKKKRKRVYFSQNVSFSDDNASPTLRSPQSDPGEPLQRPSVFGSF